MIANPRAILFDLDGTLVDSAPDIGASLGRAMRRVGHDMPSDDNVRQFIGSGAGRLVHRALTGDMDGEADPELFAQTLQFFFDEYENNICEHSVLYPGVQETLDRLRSAQFTLACVTNKPERFARALLEAIKIAPQFKVCLGGDSLPVKKPDPLPLITAAEHCGVAPEQCLMVGDTTIDCRAAYHAKMPVIGVTYGYGEVRDLRAENPLALIDRLDQIFTQLPLAA